MITTRTMTDVDPPFSGSDSLLSDEPTLELVLKARSGDRSAVEALLQRCLPGLKRWAHGRLPAYARESLDTADLVQEAALHLLKRVDDFEPQHVGAMQAYLRQSVINRIRDEIRRVVRRPAPVELIYEPAADAPSPLELMMQDETYERYRSALDRLAARDRKLVVARMEAQWSMSQIADGFQLATPDAARMAVNRALKRLTAEISAGADQTS
jgi:RNA polymerase sigma-70 factor (ECF subfamily)